MTTNAYPACELEPREFNASGWIALALVVVWLSTLLVSLSAMWRPSWMYLDGVAEHLLGLAHGLAVLPGLILPALLCLQEVRARLNRWEVGSWIVLGVCAYTTLWRQFL